MKTKQNAAAGLACLILATVVTVISSSNAWAGSVPAPMGFQILCLKSPAECRGGGPAQLQYSDQSMATMKQVNLSVNKQIRPRNDSRGVDVWTVNARYGDCEDYALTKRQALIRAGLPASSLRLAYVKTRRNEDHLVLVVKTSRGEFVLDNLTNAIRPLSQSGLRLISMSGADPRVWS